MEENVLLVIPSRLLDKSSKKRWNGHYNAIYVYTTTTTLWISFIKKSSFEKLRKTLFLVNSFSALSSVRILTLETSNITKIYDRSLIQSKNFKAKQSGTDREKERGRETVRLRNQDSFLLIIFQVWYKLQFAANYKLFRGCLNWGGFYTEKNLNSFCCIGYQIVNFKLLEIILIGINY